MGANGSFKLSAAVRSDVGRVRGNNEDNYYLCGTYRRDVSIDNSATDATVSGGQALFAVCDGMGGQENGEKASLIAVRHLKPYPVAQIKEHAQADFLAANDETCEEIRRNNGLRMGSTVAALYVDSGRAFAGNIGDSRIYLLRDGALRQLSEDHDEASRLVKLNMLTPEQAMTDKRRHRLTQHLGLFHDEVIPEAYWAEEITLMPDDRFLICSDGVTDMLTNGEILSVINRGQSAKDAADELVEAALEAGGRDNTTALIVDVQGKAPARRRRLPLILPVAAVVCAAAFLPGRQLLPGFNRSAVIQNAAYEIEGVRVVAQQPELPAGCEVSALTMALLYAGYDADQTVLAKTYLKKADIAAQESPYEYFIGDPAREDGLGCFAPVIAECATRFGAPAEDVSGADFERLLMYVENNVPVVVWVTEGLDEAREGAYAYQGKDGETAHWTENGHCVLLCGFDQVEGTVTAADPESGGMIRYETERFRMRYEEMNRQAVVISGREG